jgi:hypothetical protein
MREVGFRSWRWGLVAVVATTLAGGPLERAVAQQKLGSEFQVNSYTTADQEDPALAVAAGGDFLVVWESWGQDGDVKGVFGQRFDRAGAKLGGEFQVNTYTTDYQQAPAVAADSSGGFIVVWEDCLQDDRDCNVFGQRFDATGARVGDEFQVNTYTVRHEPAKPEIAADASGHFVVVWRDYYDVVGQRFDATGAKLGGEFQVNTYTTDTQYRPAVAADANGSFVVAWQSYDQDGDADGVFGQRFDGAGGRLGGEFQVNTQTQGYQSDPAVAPTRSGGFVVVWENYTYGEGGESYNIAGQRFDGTGARVGGEFQVNTHETANHFRPAVASDRSGNFVVAWNRSYPGDAPFSPGVFGQRFDSAGTKLGSEFQVNSYTTNDQDDPVVAADASGNFVVVWQSYEQDGDGPGVFGQRFSALRSGCRAAGEQDVALKAQGGKLDWSWKKGGATVKADFGDPSADTAYRVCVYDSVAGLCSDVLPGADWREEANGFRFKSPAGVEGITAIQLEAGEAGRAELRVMGRGMALPELPLTQQPEVVLELSNSAGQCWQSHFATAHHNDASKFTAKE